MKLTIVRGIPGSGKSTLALKLLADYQRNMDDAVRLEADLFHTMGDGTYNYKPEFAGLAHQFCSSNTAFYLNKGVNVIVANTFILPEHIDQYYEMALRFGAEFEIINCEGEYENVHNVPAEVLERMKNAFEYMPTEDYISFYMDRKHFEAEAAYQQYKLERIQAAAVMASSLSDGEVDEESKPTNWLGRWAKKVCRG